MESHQSHRREVRKLRDQGREKEARRRPTLAGRARQALAQIGRRQEDEVPGGSHGPQRSPQHKAECPCHALGCPGSHRLHQPRLPMASASQSQMPEPGPFSTLAMSGMTGDTTPMASVTCSHAQLVASPSTSASAGARSESSPERGQPRGHSRTCTDHAGRRSLPGAGKLHVCFRCNWFSASPLTHTHTHAHAPHLMALPFMSSSSEPLSFPLRSPPTGLRHPLLCICAARRLAH